MATFFKISFTEESKSLKGRGSSDPQYFLKYKTHKSDAISPRTRNKTNSQIT